MPDISNFKEKMELCGMTGANSSCRLLAKRTASSDWVAALDSEFFPSPLGLNHPPFVPKIVINIKKMRKTIEKVRFTSHGKVFSSKFECHQRRTTSG